MSIISFVRILRRRWLLVTLCVLGGILAASGVSASMTKMYAAEARSFVTVTSTASDSSSAYANSQFAAQRVKSYTLLVDSPAILRPVISNLDLALTTDQLAGMVSVENPLDTAILNVSVVDSDPKRAADLANAVAVQMDSAIEKLETPRSGDSSPVKVTVTAPATSPGSPESPVWPLNLALGLLLGFAVGVLAAVSREHLDTAIRSEQDLQALAGMSPLGNIPLDAGATNGPLLALDSRSHLLESFRTLRSNLRFAHVDNPVTRIVVTSALPAEGKSTTAQNLAIAMAQSGIRVCLVDADLRHPSITDNLGIEGVLGLTDVLVEEYTLDDVLVPWNRGLLHVLPAGTTPFDPGTLLGSHRMEEVLRQLSSRFEFIIIDSPPLLPVSDAAVIAGLTDGVLMVARVGKTKRDQLRKALEALEVVGANLLGVVLTFVPDSGVTPYYGSTASQEVVRLRHNAAISVGSDRT